MTPKRHTTKVLLQAGRDVVIFGCCSLSASVSAGQAPFGLLFVIFYFYIFIQQRLGADTAMNSMPAAIPNRKAQAGFDKIL